MTYLTRSKSDHQVNERKTQQGSTNQTTMRYRFSPNGYYQKITSTDENAENV